jgi:acetoacetyl-CoA synthetase
MANRSTLATMDALSGIWQRVFERPGLDVEDNFFELGGDPSSAVQLFREIARVCGRELPALTIYQAPTIATLAALLAHPAPAPFPTLVPMRPGSHQPAIFITHGLGGSVMETFHLVKAIQSDHPIYGLQSRGFYRDEQPLTRVEDIARQYLNAMKELQPEGPYILIGYSFGGLVMLEVAQELCEQGESVALLALLETYPHNNWLPATQRLALSAYRVKRHLGVLSRLSMRQRIAYLTSHGERVRASFQHNGESEPPEAGIAYGPERERFTRAGVQALMRYRPRFYNRKMNFVKAAKASFAFPDDPQGIWEKLTTEFEMDIAPGDHFSMVTTEVRDLAAVLSRRLAAALREE